MFVALVLLLVGMTHHPSGFYGQYAYDWQGRCTGAYAGSTTLSRYTFAGDWLSGRALANGLCTTYGYQANGRVNEVWHRHGDLNSVPNGPSVSHYRYGYEPDGQLSWLERRADGGESGSLLENGNGDAFSYFPDGTLNLHFRNLQYSGGWPWRSLADSTGASKGDSQVTIYNPTIVNQTADTYGSNFSYDAAGNRQDAFQGNPQKHYKYDYTPIQGDNKYGTVSDVTAGTSAAPAYDNNFNTTNALVGWTYTYDAENHLTAATGPGGQSASFQYDGAGRLIVQAVGGSVTHFYYAGSQRVEERNAANQVTQNYLFDAPGGDRILLRSGQYGTVWYQYDLMGNTSHLSDGSGNVVEQYLYDAWGQPSVYDKFGNARTGGSLYDNRYLFKGAGAYEWLAPMGLYYCQARFYLPYHGRWLQPDPIGQAGGLNIYTYCGNDPVNGSDPSGLWFDRGGNETSEPVIHSYGANAFHPPASMINPGCTVTGFEDVGDGRHVYIKVTYPDGNGGQIVGLATGENGVIQYAPPSTIRGIENGLILAAINLTPLGQGLMGPDPFSGGNHSDQYTDGGINKQSAAELVTQIGAPIALGVGFKLTLAGTVEEAVGAGTLTVGEANEIQAISDKHITTIDVVGSRAAGAGRNIESDLPVGKGPGTRSDIDFRIDSSHPSAQQIAKELRMVGKGAGSAKLKFNTNTRPTKPPYIRFSPKNGQ